MADQTASEAGSALAKRKWAKKSKAERTAIAVAMNDARWAEHRKQVAAGEIPRRKRRAK
jgi:hypothetical protein